MQIKITFLTPAFLYGADQTKPEFRIASLIGQMRYWWRMTQDWSSPAALEHMKRKEAEIFGSQAGAKPFYTFIEQQDIRMDLSPKKEGSVNERISQNDLPESFIKEKEQYKALSYDSDKNKLFWKNFMDEATRDMLLTFFVSQQQSKAINGLYAKAHRYVYSNANNGLSYLFYPFNQNRSEPFSWIAPRSNVTVCFDFLNEESKKHILLSLFLLSRFGGLGSRSRRGAGALKIESAEEDGFNQTEDDLVAALTDNGAGHTLFSLVHSASPLKLALANSLRYKTNIQPTATWSDTLNYAGQTMHGFRTKQKLRDFTKPFALVHPDFQAEAIDLHIYSNSGTLPAKRTVFTKDAFGLPRIVNFSSPPPSDSLMVAPFDNNNDPMRRASPLHITVNQNSANQYYCIAMVLWDGLTFLPKGVDLKIKKGRAAPSAAISLPAPDKIEDLLRRL